jgi:hypothetical protein
MLTFAYGGSSPAHILGITSVPLALGSPFGFTLSAAIPPPATLWKKGGKIYSLFLIGLQYFSTLKMLCQGSISRNIHSFFLICSALIFFFAVK